MARRRKKLEEQHLKKSVDRLQAEKRRRERTILTWGVVAVLIAIVAVIFFGLRTPGTTEYVPLAECMTAADAAMYGTDWCPHCQEQKRLFGKAWKEVTYYNCDYAPECAERGISGYPTWVFGDGSRLQGRQPLALLAEKTNCTAYLPDYLPDEPPA